MVPVVGFLPPTWETWIDLLATGFTLVQPWLFQAIGRVKQLMLDLSLSVFLPLFLSLSLCLSSQ